MKYIKDKRKYDKIVELAKNGDNKARDFLENFLDIDDNKANDYLNSINVDNYVDSELTFLIQDEIEAINGYTNVLEHLKSVELSEEKRKEINEKLQYIIKDEQEHIDILKGLLGEKNNA